MGDLEILNMKTFIKILAWPLTFLIGVLAKFMIRDENIWLFGCYQNRFSDNSMYFFKHCSTRNGLVRSVWISGSLKTLSQVRSLGFEAHHRYSFKGIYLGLKAGKYFYSAYVSDINHFTCQGSTKFNLWHGLNIKAVEFDIDRGPLRRLFNEPTILERYVTHSFIFEPPSYVLSSTPFVSKNSFLSAFRVRQDQMLEFGYPRNDILDPNGGKNPSELDAVPLELTTDNSDFVLYLPTWRDDPNFEWPFSLDDIKSLSRKLSGLNLRLVVKPHPNTPVSKFHVFGQADNISVLESDVDIYPLLRSSRCLVSDVSSILFDYLLTQKPVFVLTSEGESYDVDNRRIYYSRDQLSDFSYVTSLSEVLDQLNGPSEKILLHRQSRLKALIHGEYDFSASKTLFNYCYELGR
jgi:CDP-glycerol glycerophosphotransferase (TagB/SpsB family)